MEDEEKAAILKKREESLDNIRQDIQNKEMNVLKKEEKAIKHREDSLAREEKYLQEREKKIVEKEKEIKFSNEAEIFEKRKERLIDFLKTDKLFSAFLIISALALLFSGLAKVGVGMGFFSARIWFMLFVFSAISALLVYFKKNKHAFLPIAAWVAWVAVEIRTLNLPGLRDITTGNWTLGPDLDPFLFLRWTKYIVAHGALMVHDAMRYVPVGYDTARELKFLPYMMAWFHKIAASFGSTSVEQSAVLFPAVMFALTVIAFFLLVKKIFSSSLGDTKASIIAVVSSFLFSVIPSFIPRTIAGIPEKESAAFLFLFLAFYFFISAWKSEKAYSRLIFSLLAGASTAGMALIWGGYIFAFLTISITVFIAFFLGQVDLNKFYIYFIWLVSTVAITMPLTARYSILGWMSSPSTAFSFFVLGLLIVHVLIHKTFLSKYFESGKLAKIPKPLLSIIITILLGIIIVSVIFGPKFILGILNDLKGNLITPTADRLGVTVAENKQPYFSEWAGSFGPSIKGIPLMFWMFFMGSVYLFYRMTKVFARKERIILSSSYLFFLVCIIFSRYSSSSAMNGTNAQSILVYALGFAALLGTLGYYYFTYYRLGESNKLKEIEFGLLMLFSFFFLCIVAARGAVRLTMMLVPPASIIVGFLVVASFSDARKIKDNTWKVIGWVLVAIVILSAVFAGYQFYLGAEGTARSYVPSSYNQQWQKAMSWVRESTPQNAVFGHWWDYGYWVQSIGERATVLDGGNSISYWDYLMGRYALTGSNETDALEFLYAHNTTHFLIDSTDIGKYPAFSSIGSNENYDRYSWFNTFVKDPKQTQETKNSTIYVYSGGFPLDADIIYYENGTRRVFIAKESNSGIIGIFVERNSSGAIIWNPIGVYITQGQQKRIPLRYAYDASTDELIDFGTGLEAGIFIMPYVSQSQNGGVSIDKEGTMMYLSNKTVMSQLARLYLYNKEDKYFKLVHSEDDAIVSQLKESNAITSDFVYYEGLRGPIKIWEISYPKDIAVDPQYLEREYPDIRLTEAKQ